MNAKQDDMFPAPSGAALRDEGMKRATEHANAVDPDWSAKAYTFLTEYARITETFTSTEVQEKSVAAGLPSPPDNRAWGSVMTKAQRAGVIKPHGWVTNTRPQAHQRPTRLWGSLKYRREVRRG